MPTEKKYQTILLEIKDQIARLTLNRPEVHNAFNDVMLNELIDVFQKISRHEEVRVVILTGNGKSFCAGADLNWMEKMIHYSYEENVADALQVSECMYRLYTLPQPTIARVNGPAIGGGMGLVTACDMAIAAEEAQFSLSEVKLGLVPACISPYVLHKAGEGACRQFFLTGERFSAERALKAGLINKVVPLEKLDEAVAEMVNQLLSSGPRALTACKELLQKVPGLDFEEAKSYTADMIARLRVGDEAQEGMKAFLEKRKPKWVSENFI